VISGDARGHWTDSILASARVSVFDRYIPAWHPATLPQNFREHVD
jgi:hypothetical protein